MSASGALPVLYQRNANGIIGVIQTYRDSYSAASSTLIALQNQLNSYAWALDDSIFGGNGTIVANPAISKSISLKNPDDSEFLATRHEILVKMKITASDDAVIFTRCVYDEEPERNPQALTKLGEFGRAAYSLSILVPGHELFQKTFECRSVISDFEGHMTVQGVLLKSILVGSPLRLWLDSYRVTSSPSDS